MDGPFTASNRTSPLSQFGGGKTKEKKKIGSFGTAPK
jgi:hypothetical protein